MKIKTSELIGPALDWAVAKCLNLVQTTVHGRGAVRAPGFEQRAGLGYHLYVLRNTYQLWVEKCEDPPFCSGVQIWCPTADWSQAGPLIETEKVAISYDAEWAYDATNPDPEDEPDNGDRWYAEIRKAGHDFIGMYGPTPLIAAMRCLVHSKLGNEVEVPDELI